MKPILEEYAIKVVVVEKKYKLLFLYFIGRVTPPDTSPVMCLHPAETFSEYRYYLHL